MRRRQSRFDARTAAPHHPLVVAALLPALVAVAGALVYALATNPKLSEMGRLMFGCGLLVCCFIAARTTLHLP